MKTFLAAVSCFCFSIAAEVDACSVVYYQDPATKKVYVANNEDYWYATKPYLQIQPKSANEHARLWYGWNDFAQGGVNAAGLFFDGAATPKQKTPAGYGKAKGNLGDAILANCATVEQALAYIEKRKVAVPDGHIMLGDKTGKAVVVEWVDGQKKLSWSRDNTLIMTNFLLADTSKGNYPCYRYATIKKYIEDLQQSKKSVDLKTVGNALGKAVQLPKADPQGKVGGTLYSSFVNLTEGEFVLVYKLDNRKTTRLDLKKEFEKPHKQKIQLND